MNNSIKSKKVSFTILLLLSFLSLVSCKKEKSAVIKNTVSSPLTLDTIKVGFMYIGSIHDEGYTTAQDRGRRALVDMGVKNTFYVENVPDNAQCEAVLLDLIQQGCSIIYSTSYSFMDRTLKIAKEYPNIKFAHCSGYKRNTNLSTYFGKMYEARYLAGIVAGLKTTSNKIGYVAAFPIPECIRGINAFTLGVQSVNKNAVIKVMWTNTWYDPKQETYAARKVLDWGADVIAQHQDTTAAQIAAQEQGAFCIGYNTATPKAAPKAYLTAPVFNWEVFMCEDVKKVIDGTWESRAYWEGLEAGIVDLSPLSALCAAGTEERVKEAKTNIVDKSLQIFSGPLYDNKGNKRVEDGVIMSESEIWNMDWFIQGVEVIEE